MSFIQLGEVVRIYYEEHCYDEGEVTWVIDDMITVDFYDWIERWHESDFRLEELFHEGKEVLIPVRRGEVVADFRRLNWARRQCRYCTRWFISLSAAEWCGGCTRPPESNAITL